MPGQDQSVKMSRQELRKLADFREMAEAHIERLGQAIMRRRKALGWSRAKLGRETNAHEKTVERWEKAQTAGALDNLEAIASALDMDPDELLSEAMVKQHRGPTPDVLGAFNGDPTQLDRIETMLRSIRKHLGIEEEEEEEPAPSRTFASRLSARDDAEVPTDDEQAQREAAEPGTAEEGR